MTALRMLLLKYYLPLFIYDKCIKIVFTCSVPIDSIILAAHKKNHRNKVHEKHLNALQIYELYRIRYNWLD